MRTLITGFGPFGPIRDNPSAWLANNSGQMHDVLEVSYAAADEFVDRLDPNSFDRWIMLGVAAGRKEMCLELFARNVRRGADARGCNPGGNIEENAPLLLGTTLWSADLCAEAIAGMNRQVRASLDAGAYLCNYISYKALRRFPDKRVGFLHVVMPEVIGLDEQAAAISRLVTLTETSER